jgi:hypothetical protein
VSLRAWCALVACAGVVAASWFLLVAAVFAVVGLHGLGWGLIKAAGMALVPALAWLLIDRGLTDG